MSEWVLYFPSVLLLLPELFLSFHFKIKIMLHAEYLKEIFKKKDIKTRISLSTQSHLLDAFLGIIQKYYIYEI